MKRKFILVLLILIVICSFFIPVNQQKDISINAPFLNVYTDLLTPVKWGKWRTDLRNAIDKDSASISTRKGKNTFDIKYPGSAISVNFEGSIFNIHEDRGNGSVNYSYTVVPDSSEKKTLIGVSKKASVIGFLINQFRKDPFADTHVNDLKAFWETDSLRYGCKITKIGVPDANLIEMKKKVPAKDKFTYAGKMRADLEQYMHTHNLKQMQPILAQFLRLGKDSTEVNVGFFVDKKVMPGNGITYAHMPKGGPLYVAQFMGPFNKRQKIYAGLRQYFTDHLYQSAILPVEMYLDNKLPTSDTDKVHVQVNFTTFF
ncbi:MAG: hypothetical protein ACTHJ8_16605 [Mucilaginibacter sp.]